MKTLYLECSMGAAGDMLTAALLELCDKQKFLEKINAIGIPKVTEEANSGSKCGICGTQMSVRVDGIAEESHDVHEHTHHHHAHHAHTSMQDIENLIHGFTVSEKVKSDAIAIYKLLAEAESHAHGKPVAEIHFHEVGTLDAVTDIVGVCMLIEEVAPEKIIASPIHVGSSHVHCAHGILPVPAPATAYLLQNIPMYGGTVEGELCTPTGAALLKYFVSEFGNMPVIKTDSIGYGFGKKEFSRLSCVRAFLGDTEDQTEQIIELKCNLDDMTGERIGLALERLFEAGALDVFTTPIGMKKNRPAILLTCLCRPQQRDTMLHEIFKHTTTIGVRETLCNRYVLDRTETVQHTQYGDVRVKQIRGYGVERSKPEFYDLARLTQKHGVAIDKIKLFEY